MKIRTIVSCLMSLTVLLMAVQSGTLLYGSNPQQRKAVDQLQTLEHLYPQQKVYLHTDKDSYLAGERLWFKAYAVTLPFHTPGGVAGNLNVELLNHEGNYIDKQIIALNYGLAYGDIQLPDSMHEGSYFLRAYTDWMKNFDEEFFFVKEMHVFNPIEEQFIRRGEIRSSRRFNSQLEELEKTYQLGLFPEGGHLVAGLENRVAFKAANELGRGVEAAGRLIDESGNELLTFESFHDGMGRFSFIPREGAVYQVAVTFEGKTEQVFAMPESSSTAYLLQVDHTPNELVVRVKTTGQAGAGQAISLLAQTRNRIQFYQQGKLENNQFSTFIPIRDLPDGICQITLFNEHEVPVAERLVFINEHGAGNVDLLAQENTVVGRANKVRLDLEFDLDQGTAGSFSVAALAAYGDKPEDLHRHIASYLLLSGDLKGYVHHPAYYLTRNDQHVKKAADLLMMTHGWKRFDWESVLAGQFPEILHTQGRGLTFSGKIVPLLRAYSFSGVNVRMAGTGARQEVFRTEADQQGRFSFSGLDYEDLFMAEISIETSAPRRAYDIVLDDTTAEHPGFSKSPLTQQRTVLATGSGWSRTSRPDYFLKSKRQVPRSSARGYYGEPDQTVYMEDLTGHYNNMLDVLRRHVRGLTIIDGNITIRGVSSFYGSSEPIYMVDGNNVDQGVFLGLRPEELDRIEVLSGSSAAIFGVRGTSGALIAYSKTAGTRSHTFEFAIRGYSTPSEFFSSRIDTKHYQEHNYQETLYWQPNLIPAEDGTARVLIPNESDHNGLILIIEGLSEEGRPYFLKKHL